jgi:hypothetical protein
VAEYQISRLVSFVHVSLVGQAVSGWKADAEEQRQYGEQGSFSESSQSLQSAEFGETVSRIGRASFLQMGFYVFLTVFLHEGGSSESKKT